MSRSSLPRILVTDPDGKVFQLIRFPFNHLPPPTVHSAEKDKGILQKINLTNKSLGSSYFICKFSIIVWLYGSRNSSLQKFSFAIFWILMHFSTRRIGSLNRQISLQPKSRSSRICLVLKLSSLICCLLFVVVSVTLLFTYVPILVKVMGRQSRSIQCFCLLFVHG